MPPTSTPFLQKRPVEARALLPPPSRPPSSAFASSFLRPATFLRSPCFYPKLIMTHRDFGGSGEIFGSGFFEPFFRIYRATI